MKAKRAQACVAIVSLLVIGAVLIGCSSEAFDTLLAGATFS